MSTPTRLQEAFPCLHRTAHISSSLESGPHAAPRRFGFGLWIQPERRSSTVPKGLHLRSGLRTDSGSPFIRTASLRKVSPSGGPTQTIAELPAFSEGTWGAKGDIIYRAGIRTPLYRIHECGGSPKQITALERRIHRSPSFLPDGRRFLFTAGAHSVKTMRCTQDLSIHQPSGG